MVYVAFVFGLFGLIAFCEIESMKKRINDLENMLAKMEGSPLYETRTSLVRVAGTYIGKTVKLHMKEDYTDFDIVNYGNTKHGLVTILDVDDDWMHVRITTPKGVKEKLLRIDGVGGIAEV